MTQEEAIKIFRKEIECLSHTKCEDCILKKTCDPMNTTPYDSEYIEAYSMAIKALEQEPTTKNDLGVDCISRFEVTEIINAEWDKDSMLDRVDALPSVTPQEPIIDKIRADINKLTVYYTTKDKGINLISQKAVNRIFEKYKTESEGE